jgi:hypothetical protein
MLIQEEERVLTFEVADIGILSLGNLGCVFE